MPISLQIKGLQETINGLRILPEEVQKIVDAELTASAYQMVDEAKILVPVDLGKLKNSIEVTRNEFLIKEVSATASYAAYVEFGTGGNVNVPNAPEGIVQYAIQFKGQGKTGKHPVKFKNGWAMVPYQLNLRARPYFFPAFNASTHDLVKRIKQIIEEEAKK